MKANNVATSGIIKLKVTFISISSVVIFLKKKLVVAESSVFEKIRMTLSVSDEKLRENEYATFSKF